MNMKIAVFVAIALAGIQMLIVALITRKYRSIFSGKSALEYPRAIHELAEKKPAAANTIKICYALLVVELVVLFFIRG
mgnify:CR=1 FL=1